MRAIKGGAEQSHPGTPHPGRSGGWGRCRKAGQGGGPGGCEGAPASNFSGVGELN